MHRRVRRGGAVVAVVAAASAVLASCSEPPTMAPVPAEPVAPLPSPDLRVASVVFGQDCPGIDFPWPWWSRVSPGSTDGFITQWTLGETGTWAVRLEGAGMFPSATVRFEFRAPDGRPRIWTQNVRLVSEPGRKTEVVVADRAWAAADTGVYVLTATIDPDRVFDEIDELNNEATDTVRILPPWFDVIDMDRYAPSVTQLEAEVVPAGTPVQFIGRMFCHGRYPALRRVVSVDGVSIRSMRSEVASGCWPGIAVDSVTWRATPGTHRIEYAIDPEHEYERYRPYYDDRIVKTLVVEP